MTRLQKIIVLVAGCLIALRLFVPVQSCTSGQGNFREAVDLPRWRSWNYDYSKEDYVETLPPDAPEGATATAIPTGSGHMVFLEDPNTPPRWVKTRQGWSKDLPPSTPLTPSPVYRWILHIPNKRPPLWKRILTLDPGGYLETSCPSALEHHYEAATFLHTAWEHHFYPGATLLHALGIATLAGMLLLVTQPGKGKGRAGQ